MKCPIGTRIRFLRTITGYCETQGPITFANAGEEGEIVGYGTIFPYRVKVDAWGTSFGAKEKDFQRIVEKAAEAKGGNDE